MDHKLLEQIFPAGNWAEDSKKIAGQARILRMLDSDSYLRYSAAVHGLAPIKRKLIGTEKELYEKGRYLCWQINTILVELSDLTPQSAGESVSCKSMNECLVNRRNEVNDALVALKELRPNIESESAPSFSNTREDLTPLRLPHAAAPSPWWHAFEPPSPTDAQTPYGTIAPAGPAAAHPNPHQATDAGMPPVSAVGEQRWDDSLRKLLTDPGDMRVANALPSELEAHNQARNHLVKELDLELGIEIDTEFGMESASNHDLLNKAMLAYANTAASVFHQAVAAIKSGDAEAAQRSYHGLYVIATAFRLMNSNHVLKEESASMSVGQISQNMDAEARRVFEIATGKNLPQKRALPAPEQLVTSPQAPRHALRRSSTRGR